MTATSGCITDLMRTPTACGFLRQRRRARLSYWPSSGRHHARRNPNSLDSKKSSFLSNWAEGVSFPYPVGGDDFGMQVKRLNDRFVVECQHCLGTTQCQHAAYFNTNPHGYMPFDEEHWLACPRCGEGYHTGRSLKNSYDPVFDPSVLHRPVCSVCEGRGFIIA